eukprot:547190-Prymnesium_polylepis.1
MLRVDGLTPCHSSTSGWSKAGAWAGGSTAGGGVGRLPSSSESNEKASETRPAMRWARIAAIIALRWAS